MKDTWTLRIARPTNRLEEIAEMYRAGRVVLQRGTWGL